MSADRVLRTEKLVSGGDALARADGRVWFVRGAWSGERVRARPLQVRKDFVRADATEILEPHPARRRPACPWQAACGGCAWMTVDESAQRAAKREVLLESLARAGCPPVEVGEFTALPAETAYRTAIECVLSDVEGEPALAFHGPRSHGTVAIEGCLVATSAVARAFADVRAVLAELPPEGRDATVRAPRPWRWTLRRDGVHGGAVVVWRRHEARPAGEAVRKALAERLVGTGRSIRGVVDVVTASHARGGGERRVLFGEGEVAERVGDIAFSVPAESFFQPHLEVAEHLRTAVLDALVDVRGTVLDLFAGVGVFGLSLASDARRAVLVEADAVAAEAARRTAARARVEADVVRGPVAAFLESWSVPTAAAVLDPPRAGLGIPVAERLAKLAIPRIVWLSCDAATFARDVKVLIAGGYRLESLRGIDAFPQTPHFETVAVLTRDGP